MNRPSANLTPVDLKVLREIGGQPQGISWEATYAESVVYLMLHGLVDRKDADGIIRYTISDKGREAIRK